MRDRHAACLLEVLERLIAMGEVLNRLPPVARGVLACPLDEALGRSVVHAEAQDFLHLSLLVSCKGFNAWGGSGVPSCCCLNSSNQLTLN